MNRSVVPNEVMLLLIILGILIFVWDMFDRLSKKHRKGTGLTEQAAMVALTGSSYLPSKRYVSTELGLSSKPDALMQEGNAVIPVDRKPLSKKVHDRHVVQLLMHMKLIELEENIRPPYGILLLGPELRTVRVKNTPEKQRWLDTLIDEMRSIMDGVPAVPSPTYQKCKRCDVQKHCKFSAYHS